TTKATSAPTKSPWRPRRKRGNSDAIAKYTYEKLYNAWAYFPCSNMPRLGHNGHLTPAQITHVVAYLTDPASPVNRK
ncbi:MAG: hypothetical protein Q7S01_01705, partial [bacterium]|nr:hypothetical protein [bacterium]